MEDRLCPSVYDLASDWSDTSNPNSVWQYRHGDTVITNHEACWDFADFQSPQPAWADAASLGEPGFIPAWFRSVTTIPGDPTYDVPIGRVATHTTDPYAGDDAALSNVVWTSPLDGVATISGDTWQARKSLGRSNTWELFHNDVLVTEGIVTSDDALNSSNPFLFQNGSGGQDVLTFPVAAGDTIKFEAVRASIYGDFVGVDLTITVTDGQANVFRPDANLLISAQMHNIKGCDNTTGDDLGNFVPPDRGALHRPIGLVTDPLFVSPSAPQGGGNPCSGHALERAARDRLFGACATETSALEPLVWFGNTKNDLIDGER
jgi:hypothetical protein